MITSADISAAATTAPTHDRTGAEPSLEEEYRTAIASSLQTLNRLLRDFGALISPPAYRHTHRHGGTDLVELLPAVVESLRGEIEQANSSLRLSITDDSIVVAADRTLLEQAMDYIVGTAVHSAAEGSRVHIDITVQDDRAGILLTVRERPRCTCRVPVATPALGEGQHLSMRMRSLRFHTAAEWIGRMGGQVDIVPNGTYEVVYVVTLPLHGNEPDSTVPSTDSTERDENTY